MENFQTTIISQIVAFNWTLLLVMEYYTPGDHLKGKNKCFKLILYIFEQFLSSSLNVLQRIFQTFFRNYLYHGV